MTQTETILNHMRTHDEITALDAFNLYGIMRLASRICDIRKMGYHVVCVRKKVQTRYGHSMVACYKLIEEVNKICAC